MVNPRSVARHITALLEPASRGSPNGNSPPIKTPEERRQGNREFLEQKAKEHGYG
jgi:hypothetical protein